LIAGFLNNAISEKLIRKMIIRIIDICYRESIFPLILNRLFIGDSLGFKRWILIGGL
jgi:hypothetical protein